jgi:hypothetical protein
MTGLDQRVRGGQVRSVLALSATVSRLTPDVVR